MRQSIYFDALLRLFTVKVIVSIGLVLVLVVATLLLVVPPRYSSASTMVLTLSDRGARVSTGEFQSTGPINPLLAYDERLGPAVSVLVEELTSSDRAESVAADVAGGGLQFGSQGEDPSLLSSRAPFIFVSATASSAEDARLLAERGEQLVRDALAERQNAAGTPPATAIAAVSVVQAALGVMDTTTYGGVAVGGGLAAALSTLLVLYVRSLRREMARTATRSEPGVVAPRDGGPRPTPPRGDSAGRQAAARLDSPTVRMGPPPRSVAPTNEPRSDAGPPDGRAV